MNLQTYLDTLNSSPETISFDDTISLIDDLYEFTPSEFRNGELTNEAGQNNGSCKIFAFAKINNISEDKTLHCFGDYYRKDVVLNPDANDHQNIRNFMSSGWKGIHFSQDALNRK